MDLIIYVRTSDIQFELLCMSVIQEVEAIPSSDDMRADNGKEK